MENEKIEEILSVYGDSILHLAYSYMHNTADAEDVLQDTIVQFIRYKPDFENGKQKKSWLLKVASNLCRNKLKSKWNHMDEIPDTFQSDGIPEESINLMNAVSRLPQKYREVIHLFYYEDMDTAAMAEILGKKESTVRSLMHRARKILKKELTEEV